MVILYTALKSVPRDVVEVGAGFAPVADGDFHGAGGYVGGVAGGLHALADQVFDFGMRAQARIEIDEEGGVRGMQVQDAAHGFHSAGEKLHLAVRVERDFVTERDEKGAVARRADGHFIVMLACVPSTSSTLLRSDSKVNGLGSRAWPFSTTYFCTR